MKVTFQIETSNKKEIADISNFLQGLADPKSKKDIAVKVDAQPEPVNSSGDAPLQEVKPDVAPVQASVVPPVQETPEPAPVSESVQQAGPDEPSVQPEGSKEELQEDIDPKDKRDAAKEIARSLIISKQHLKVQAVMKKHGVSSVTVAPEELVPAIYADLKALV